MTKILKDSASVVIMNYIMLVANYIFATLLLRAGFDALYGHFVFLNNLQNFILILLGVGLQMSILRASVSEVKFRELSKLLNFCMQLILIVSALVYLSAQGLDPEVVPIVVLSYVTTYMAVTQPFFQWHEKMPQYQFLNMVIAVIKVIFSCALFMSYTSDLHIFWGLAIATLIYSFFSVFRSGVFQIPSHMNWRQNLKVLWGLRSGALWISLISLAVYNRITILILPLLGYEAADIGNYGYSFSLLAAVLMLPGVLQMVLMRPIFSAKINGSVLWGKVHFYYIVAGVFVGGIFSFMFAPVVNWAAGVRPDIQTLLQAFAPSIPLVFVANLLGLALLGDKRDNIRTMAQVVAAISIVISVLILVPRFGLVGAAYATTISYFVLYFGYFIGVMRYNCWELNRSLVPLLLYGVILLFAGWSPIFIFFPTVLLPLFYLRRPVDTSKY